MSYAMLKAMHITAPNPQTSEWFMMPHLTCSPSIPSCFLGCDKGVKPLRGHFIQRGGKNCLIAAWNNMTCVRSTFTNAHLCKVTLSHCTRHYQHIHIYQSTFVGVIKWIAWTHTQLPWPLITNTSLSVKWGEYLHSWNIYQSLIWQIQPLSKGSLINMV